ncbi:transmembrane protein, putative [Bodo saltans]|uniref:Transmembrane protein, putative n=1 Tax=Bodo saltans TaxID=75058 RepID=A0A0S4IN48_BODSA|nr:transmembrane protein, putative [Bodo saltans]|eukprot:CUE77156.1 transmembrane protein, putative [Bodo saltans]
MTASSRIVSATDRFPSAFLAAKATAMDSRKSHNQFKSSVFEATNATAAMTSGREGGIPTENPASEKSKNQQEIALYNPWSLMFSTSGNDNDNSTSVLEDLFATKFYHQNRHSALAGVLFIACLCLLMLGVTYVDPKYNFRLYRVTTYVGLLLFAVGIISTVINAILQKILLSTPTTESVAQHSPTSARRSGELIHRDATTRDLFKWWERSLVIQRLASLCMCFAVVVGKKAGCIAATDPIAVKLCTTSIQLDAAILMLTAAHCLMYPLRWVFHLPLTLMTLVILFGIRFIPGIAVIDEKFMITFALVMVLPIAMFLVIRYLRERDLRQLFLAELQLETTLEHLTVVSARHETLLVPCVPLPVEEQVKLLQRSHSTHNSHADYLWGLGHETIIGMLQLDNFSHWVQQAGACESARALATLVKTVDKYYELLSPQTMSLLKCHVDGDRYLLVSPDAGDVGILMLIMLLARREYEFRREFPSETQRPAVHAAVTSGVLGVTGIGASGTLTPCGPALDRVRVALQLAPRQQDGSILDDQVGEEEIRVSPDVATTLSLHLLDNVWRGGVPSTMFEASNNSSATSSVMMFAKVPFTHLIPSVNARNEMNTALLADRLAAKALAQRSSVFLICIAAGTDDGSNVPHSQTMGDPFVAAALQQLSTKATRSASSSCLKVMMGGSAIQRGSFSEHNISSSVNSASAIARPPQNPSTGGTPLMIATGSSALQPPLTAATATPLMMTMAVKPPLVSFSAGAAGTSSSMNSELGRSGGPNVKDQKGGSEGNSPPPQQASTASASLILQQTAIAPPPPPSPSPLCTDLTMIQRCPLAPLQKFLNIDTEKRFQLHARHSVSGTELLAVSIGSFLSAVFVIIICCLYEITSFELISPMSFSVAAASFGAVLILLALLHGYVQQSDRRRRKILVAHELLFVCFYAMIVGMNYSAKPQSSAVGASQLVWLYMLLSLNFVRPRAHGVLPHIALDTLGSLAFLLQAQKKKT